MIIVQFIAIVSLGGSHFRQLSDSSTCTCPDDIASVTYECTAIGGLGTIWTGSVISKLCEDSGGEILLLHSCFESDIYLNQSITSCGIVNGQLSTTFVPSFILTSDNGSQDRSQPSRVTIHLVILTRSSTG